MKRKTNEYLLFVKLFSWETDLSATPGDLTARIQNWKQKSALHGELIEQNNLCCAADDYNCICQLVQEDSNSSFWQNNEIFTKVPQNLTTSQKYKFLSYNWTFWPNGLATNVFFIFARLWAIVHAKCIHPDLYESNWNWKN